MAVAFRPALPLPLFPNAPSAVVSGCGGCGWAWAGQRYRHLPPALLPVPPLSFSSLPAIDHAGSPVPLPPVPPRAPPPTAPSIHAAVRPPPHTRTPGDKVKWPDARRGCCISPLLPHVHPNPVHLILRARSLPLAPLPCILLLLLYSYCCFYCIHNLGASPPRAPKNKTGIPVWFLFSFCSLFRGRGRNAAWLRC